MSDSDINIQMK